MSEKNCLVSIVLNHKNQKLVKDYKESSFLMTESSLLEDRKRSSVKTKRTSGALSSFHALLFVPKSMKKKKG